MLRVWNDKQCDITDVRKAIDRGDFFGWSWSKDKSEPLRHVAIALHINRKPCFTVNFQPENGTTKPAALFSECKELITIEPVEAKDTKSVDFFKPFEEFQIVSPKGKREANGIVDEIMLCTAGNYNLVFNNCRDHVAAVVQHMVSKRPRMKTDQYYNKMNEVRVGDINRYTGAVAGIFAVIGVAVAGVAQFVGRSNNEEEENEDQLVPV